VYDQVAKGRRGVLEPARVSRICGCAGAYKVEKLVILIQPDKPDHTPVLAPGEDVTLHWLTPDCAPLDSIHPLLEYKLDGDFHARNIVHSSLDGRYHKPETT